MGDPSTAVAAAAGSGAAHDRRAGGSLGPRRVDRRAPRIGVGWGVAPCRRVGDEDDARGVGPRIGAGRAGRTGGRRLRPPTGWPARSRTRQIGLDVERVAIVERRRGKPGHPARLNRHLGQQVGGQRHVRRRRGTRRPPPPAACRRRRGPRAWPNRERDALARRRTPGPGGPTGPAAACAASCSGATASSRSPKVTTAAPVRQSRRSGQRRSPSTTAPGRGVDQQRHSLLLDAPGGERVDRLAVVLGVEGEGLVLHVALLER